MRKLMVVITVAALVATGCGETEPDLQPADPVPVEEPDLDADRGRETLDASGGSLSPAAEPDNNAGLMDPDDPSALWEAEMVASMPLRVPGSDPAAYIAALQNWETEQIAAVQGGDPTPVELETDRCVVEAFAVSVTSNRLEQIAATLGEALYNGIPADAVTSDERAAFVDAARFECGAPLAAVNAPKATRDHSIATQEMLARCEIALAADDDFVAAAAQAEMFNDIDQAYQALHLAEAVCDPQQIMLAGRGDDRPVYSPGDDPVAYIDALLAWTNETVAAAVGVEITEQSRSLDSCLAASVAAAVERSRLEEIAAAFDIAGELTTTAVTSEEIAVFAITAVAECGGLLIAESDAVINEMVAVSGMSPLPESVATELTARRGDCVAELAASPQYMLAAAQTAIFVDAPAQDAMERMWGELCTPYLTLVVTEQLATSGIRRDAAECMAPIVLAGIGTTDPDVAFVNALVECDLP